MKKRLFLLLIGTILFLTSFPLAAKMVVEVVHDQQMRGNYTVTNINEGFPPTDSTFQFENHVIEIEETLTEEEQYQDPWSNTIGIGDLAVKLNGQEIDNLKGYPIRVAEEGLNRYHGDVGYFMIKEKKSEKTQLMVVLKKTKELPKEKPNGDIVGMAPSETLTYALYTIEEDGQVKREQFNISERNALQTELLNSGTMAHHRLGYYTDAWERYPSLVFPFIFPFGMLVLGMIFLVVYFRIRKATKSTE
ncbi:hypothetical protein [Bacillus sp. CGMCC 1.16541]|uniref:hypothetical protein n=1 Tax=Bacillus sp. CGMCC 1.16541 TaxID=2185143 RepID=UPI000D7283FC|nr:hypothetical protein [Bacillus sp. CGMCC 1.16541]